MAYNSRAIDMAAPDGMRPFGSPALPFGFCAAARRFALFAGPQAPWLRIIAATVLLWLQASTVLAAGDFIILTEELPPFGFMENGEVKGLCTEIVREVLKKMHHPDKISIYSWSRAYNLTLQNEGHILFSTIRTESREKLFKWVGPILTDHQVFFAKKGSGLVLRSLDDAKRVKSIGTYKDDVGEVTLREKGFTNVSSILDDKFNVQKLVAGRIDLWSSGEFNGPYLARKLGLEDQIENVFVIEKTDNYMAFNKNTPDEEIARWQKALDEVKAEPVYGQIMRKYGIKHEEQRDAGN